MYTFDFASPLFFFFFSIGKAQEVESELIENHQIETTQLHKKIAEKDDDLKRTVKKYEEILEVSF